MCIQKFVRKKQNKTKTPQTPEYKVSCEAASAGEVTGQARSSTPILHYQSQGEFAADLIEVRISTYSIFFCNLRDTLINYK